jgi:hypothetical protein
VLQLFSLLGPLGMVGTVFWVWMLYDCIQNERDRQTWLWLLIFLNVIGAFLYFISRWLPRAQFPLPAFCRRWTRQDDLWQAEAAARNIGKAHQYVQLGNILYDMGDRVKAADAYTQALTREPDNVQALWGNASIALDQKKFSDAQPYLKELVRVRPDFMYGDPSLTYGRVLFQMGVLDAAKSHLEQHLKSWTHPEAYMLLAKIEQRQGNTHQAREALETMIIKIKSSTPYHFRRNRSFVREGEKMLKGLAR